MKTIKINMIYLGLTNNISEYMKYIMPLNLDLYDHNNEIFISSQIKNVLESNFENYINKLNSLADDLLVNADKLYSVVVK